MTPPADALPGLSDSSDSGRDAELERREAAVRRQAGLPDAPESADAGPGLHNDLMRRARRRAAEHCLQALDRALGTMRLSRRSLPDGPLAIEPFGTLRFAAEGDELHQRLRVEFVLAPGKMADRGAILAYEQELVAAYTAPASLALALYPDDGGPPLEIAGPRLQDQTLVWEADGAQLGAYWRTYRPRLDCCLAPAERQRRYAVGQAATAGDAPGDADAEGRAVVFSSEEEGADAWVVGIEWRAETGAGDEAGNEDEFALFKERLGRALGDMRIPYTCLSEFPASGRLYLSLTPADRPRLEACLNQLNRDS